ncbi:MAG: roadblock/LC7 domain-containing protein [Candidatus Binatia bacterium]
MSERIQKTLLALKDVQGIQGSFVLNGEGKLLAMEMPSLFEATSFAELGPRIERLAESFSALGEEMESCMVRFSDHMLYVKQFGKGGALCILTTAGVNLPALKMAINLAHRRLASEIATAPLVSTAPASVNGAATAGVILPEAAKEAGSAADEPGEEVAIAVAEHRPQRFYRGHPVLD